MESAGPVLDAIFEHVDDPPATPVADNRERAIKWLEHHVRKPEDTYFAYEDASVQDVKAAARAAGVTGNTQQSTLLTYMTLKSRLKGVRMKLFGKRVKEKAAAASDAIGTLHVAHFVLFEDNHLGFLQSSTVTSRSISRTSRTRLRSPSMLSFHRSWAVHLPSCEERSCVLQWALENNYPAIGFYSAYPGLGVQDIKPSRRLSTSPSATRSKGEQRRRSS